MKSVKISLLAILFSTLVTIPACAKETDSKASIETASIDASSSIATADVSANVSANASDNVSANAKASAKVNVNAPVETAVSNAVAVTGVATEVQARPELNAQNASTHQTESPQSSSEQGEIKDQWVKISGIKKEGAPSGTKTVPVMEELGPASELLKLDQYHGKVVYLDFWASWCTPCRDSFPWMNKMQEKYKDDLVVVAVNLDEDPENANKFLEKYPANFRIVYDQFWQAGREYGIYGLPFSFVYNRKGELVGKHGGFKQGDEINLDHALNNLITSGD